MKRSDLRQLVPEEIKLVLNEDARNLRVYMERVQRNASNARALTSQARAEVFDDKSVVNDLVKIDKRLDEVIKLAYKLARL